MTHWWGREILNGEHSLGETNKEIAMPRMNI
jgi:hypothetical protein